METNPHGLILPNFTKMMFFILVEEKEEHKQEEPKETL